ncbi:MAG: DUF2163 domain-containing protein [Pseudomonadota bacterium]
MMTVLYDGSTNSLHTTCQCWVITRQDGEIVRLTEHDRALRVGEDTYFPGALIEHSSFILTSDLTPGRAEMDGALDSEAFDETDVKAGLWDHARVDVHRVDWRSGEILSHIWSGFFGAIEIRGSSFSVDLISLKSQLSRLIGRAYTRQCDAVLGDGRCGVDLNDPAHAGKVCDRSLSTCATRFGNAVNFRGFAHMPGSDFLLAGPNAESGR